MSFSILSRRICTHRLPLTRALTTSLPPKVFPPGHFGFALDIDGVLLRGPEPHPSAKKALTKLRENDIPFILLTNGGGLSEAARCEDLSSKLDFQIAPSQLVQSHTPAKAYANTYETILVVGGEGENCRRIAEEYGFKNVFIPDDFYATDPDISPFTTSPRPAYARDVPKGTKIDAIFVFNDPRDWALSTQLMIDLLRSDNGVYGTVAEPGSKLVPTFFTNADLVWASQYHIPRLGQGAFRRAVISIYHRFNDSPTRGPARLLGKPTLQTFKYAQQLLVQNLISKLKETSPELEFNDVTYELPEALDGAIPEGEPSPRIEAEDTGTPDAVNQRHREPPKINPTFERVYMIGDNPESDILGANKARRGSTVWWSLLVRSGVWREPQDTRNPTAIVDDVLAAVDWAVENEQKIRDGVALEEYPLEEYSLMESGRRNWKPRFRRFTPGSRGAEVGKVEGGESSNSKMDSAMKETKGGDTLEKKKADGESGSDSD